MPPAGSARGSSGGGSSSSSGAGGDENAPIDAHDIHSVAHVQQYAKLAARAVERVAAASQQADLQRWGSAAAAQTQPLQAQAALNHHYQQCSGPQQSQQLPPVQRSTLALRLANFRQDAATFVAPRPLAEDGAPPYNPPCRHRSSGQLGGHQHHSNSHASRFKAPRQLAPAPSDSSGFGAFGRFACGIGSASSGGGAGGSSGGGMSPLKMTQNSPHMFDL